MYAAGERQARTKHVGGRVNDVDRVGCQLEEKDVGVEVEDRIGDKLHLVLSYST